MVVATCKKVCIGKPSFPTPIAPDQGILKQTEHKPGFKKGGTFI